MLALLMTACCLFSCGEKSKVNEQGGDDSALTSKISPGSGDNTE